MDLNRTAVTVERSVAASLERVFEAFTRPELLAQWWGMKDSVVIHCEAEVKVGGGWRIGTRSFEGVEYWVNGFYRKVVRPSELMFTWNWEKPATSAEMLVTVTFSALAESSQQGSQQTVVRVVHESFVDEQSRRLHEQGWCDSLTALDRLFVLDKV
jgi:uncharacterized protein YndB with AHSA1/START domain